MDYGICNGECEAKDTTIGLTLGKPRWSSRTRRIVTYCTSQGCSVFETLLRHTLRTAIRPLLLLPNHSMANL